MTFDIDPKALALRVAGECADEAYLRRAGSWAASAWANLSPDELDALAAFLREAVSDGWQDIASAPKDGTQIMISGVTPGTSNRWQAVGAWWHDDWRDSEDDMFGFHAPSHWRPLPPPPARIEDSEEPSHG